MVAMLMFLFGLACLWKGGDWLVEGGKKLGRHLNIPEILIGLTVIAFGTSAPELIVNIIASFNNSPDIIFGNIIGSNNSNTLLIIGVTALLFPISIQKTLFKQEIPFYFFTTLIFSVLLFRHIPPILTRWDAVILLILFHAFLALIFFRNKAQSDTPHEKPTENIWMAVAMVGLGCIFLPLGGKLVVDAATTLARAFHLSEALIAATIVALGTSLPELAASVTAALKREPEMVLGNIIGSNIFNILLILGVSAAIRPVPFSSKLFFDLSVMWGSLIGFAILGLAPISYRVGRVKGFLLTLGYILYIGLLIVRG